MSIEVIQVKEVKDVILIKAIPQYVKEMTTC